MSLLHDSFHTHNLPLFRRLLLENQDKGHLQPSVNGPKSSHKKQGLLSIDVNGRDWLGRSVLHLVSASIEHREYLCALLKHPAINVNLVDEESRWTPLHRALYNANIFAARLLLQRSDVDITIRDNEGYTAFDVYNSTLNGTKPIVDETGIYAELHTWGTNVNATLGLGDSNDRAYPEHVSLRPRDDVDDLERKNLSAKFRTVQVKDVAMSKLHTAVITSESGGNLRVCGFGSGGRLGQCSHMQYTFKPISQLSQTVVSVALGQDHTLVLTRVGEVLSWGLNRFSQLGYPVDPPAAGRSEEPIQYTPRKVQGFLRKEVVKGVAASKYASACWTDNAVYTWGTNNGQLGYDKAAQPVQVLPRKVSRLVMPVVFITMTDNTMACLMQNGQVECFYNNAHHRIGFPVHAFPSPISPYRPPQTVKDSRMAKITSCGDLLASLSYHGEVYIFAPVVNSSSSSAFTAASTSTPCTAPFSSVNIQTPDGDTATPSRTGGPFRCQRVWALRKKSSAVKDVALGVDGSIIVCTESGHVFVRTRNATKFNIPSSPNLFTSPSLASSTLASSNVTSQKAFKFHRVPFLQRVIRVCANSAGAFGALRVEMPVKKIEVTGDLIGTELRKVGPWLDYGKKGADELVDVFGWSAKSTDEDFGAAAYKSHAGDISADSDNDDIEGEMEDEAVEGDIRALKEICDVIRREEEMRADGEGEQSGGGIELEEMELPHGADMLVVCEQSGAVFPAHKVVLAARSEVLCRLLSTSSSVRDDKSGIEINSLPSVTHHCQFPSRLGPRTTSLLGLQITKASPLAILVILTFLYSNNIITVWDHRIATVVAPYAQKQLKLSRKWDIGKMRNEVAGLARALELRDVLSALERPVKIVLSSQTGIVKDLMRVFDIVNPLVQRKRDHDKEECPASVEGEGAQAEVCIPAALRPDVILEIEDREIYTHSVILRARSELIKSFFDEPDWTRKRWVKTGGGDVVLRVDLKHLNWRVMELVMKFMCCGHDREIFETLEFVKSADDLVEFMFEVMAAANELLLDRLVLLCSDIILTYSSIHNACYILSEATHFSAIQLIDRIQSYITANMELFLESHMLDDISQQLVLQLARYAQQKQREKAPFVRGGGLVTEAMVKWLNWVEEQDIPVPFVRSGKLWKEKKRVLPIPKFENQKEGSAVEKGLKKPSSSDDLFFMDDTEGLPQSQMSTQVVAQGRPAWKTYVIPRVDMKAVMAEAAQDQMNLVNTKSPDISRTPSKASLKVVRKDSLRMTGSPSSQPQGPQQQKHETANVLSSGPTSQSPSTPAKLKDSVRIGASGSQGKVPGVSQVQSGVTPTKHGTTSNLSSVSSGGAAPGSVMGPTIIPMRMSASTSKGSGQRNVSGSGRAWAPRPIDTLVPIVPASQDTFKVTASRISSDVDASNPKYVSFLAIQHSQQEERLSVGDMYKDRQSLAEIQEEEKARREEEIFLQWWEEEEARVKMEIEALEAFKKGEGPSRKKSKALEGGRGRGRGGVGERSERGGASGRGGGAGGGRRGETKASKEDTRANHQVDAAKFEGQSVADDIAPSQSRPSEKNVVVQTSTSERTHPRCRDHRHGQKNPHHRHHHYHHHDAPHQQQITDGFV